MDLVSLALLFWVGFSIGLSGALIPGPLLAYTLDESLRRGRWTGFKVIVGHVLVEVVVVLLFVYGLLHFLDDPIVFSCVSVLGGLFLLYTSYELFREARRGTGVEDFAMGRNVAYPTIVGGILFTCLNPAFPLWWVTVGSRMLLEGLRQAGMAGVWTIVCGHWLADFGWYVLVGVTTHSKKDTLLERGWLHILKRALAVFLACIGAYFMYTGLSPS